MSEYKLIGFNAQAHLAQTAAEFGLEQLHVMRREYYPPVRAPESLPRPSNDARQHAGAGRSLAIGRLRALPPRSGTECGRLGRCRAGAGVRPADGLYVMRDRRRAREAELAGTAGPREPDWRHLPNHDQTIIAKAMTSAILTKTRSTLRSLSRLSSLRSRGSGRFVGITGSPLRLITRTAYRTSSRYGPRSFPGCR